MPALRLLPLMLVIALPIAARAEIGAADLPAEARWYLHADLAAMRDADSGSTLYGWLDGEVFADVKRDIGIDLGKEVDSVTAFADAALGTVVVVRGPISRETRDKVLALTAAESKLDTFNHDGKTYYHVQRPAKSTDHGRRLD
ncbi:MAG TPA: hypothetical protein VE175_08855, partial [Woeseiaceae bacterium]|nr:hypothetical protein [Woeseiaceae bacterium]